MIFFNFVFVTFVEDEYTSPMFPYTFWSVYQRVLEYIPSTNNAVEGWNNRFTQTSGTRHPRFLVFVDQLKNEPQKTGDDIEISTSGVEKRKKVLCPLQ